MKLTESTLKQIISEVIAEMASEPPDVMRKLPKKKEPEEDDDVMRKGPLPHDPEMGIPMNSPRRKTADWEDRVSSMAKRMRDAGITGRLPVDPTTDRYERERLRRARADRAKFARQGGGGVYDGDRPGRLEGKVSYVLDNAQTSDPKVRRSVMRIIKDLQFSAKTSPKAQTFLDLIQQEAPELFGAMPKAPFLKESTLKQIIREEILAVISEVTTKREALPNGQIKVIKSYGGKTGVGIARNPNLASQKAQMELDKQLKAAPAPSPASAKAAKMPAGPRPETAAEKAAAEKMEREMAIDPRKEKELIAKLGGRQPAPRKAAPAKPAPAGAKYDPNNRRSINAALKSGAISKDEWRKARRALARKLRKGKKRKKPVKKVDPAAAAMAAASDPFKAAAAAPAVAAAGGEILRQFKNVAGMKEGKE